MRPIIEPHGRPFRGSLAAALGVSPRPSWRIRALRKVRDFLLLLFALVVLGALLWGMAAAARYGWEWAG